MVVVGLALDISAVLRMFIPWKADVPPAGAKPDVPRVQWEIFRVFNWLTSWAFLVSLVHLLSVRSRGLSLYHAKLAFVVCLLSLVRGMLANRQFVRCGIPWLLVFPAAFSRAHPSGCVLVLALLRCPLRCAVSRALCPVAVPCPPARFMLRFLRPANLFLPCFVASPPAPQAYLFLFFGVSLIYTDLTEDVAQAPVAAPPSTEVAPSGMSSPRNKGIVRTARSPIALLICAIAIIVPLGFAFMFVYHTAPYALSFVTSVALPALSAAASSSAMPWTVVALLFTYLIVRERQSRIAIASASRLFLADELDKERLKSYADKCVRRRAVVHVVAIAEWNCGTWGRVRPAAIERDG